MSEQAIKTAAENIRQAYETGIACQPVRDILPENDIDAAYQVQKINNDYWVKAGRERTGFKIGLTAKAVQKQLGVDQPDFGQLFSDMAIPDGAPIPSSAVMQPKAEAEIAFMLKKSLQKKRHNAADIIAATAFILPAIEIVGSRIADWNIKIVDTVADNASSGLFVLGNSPKLLKKLDLGLCGMVMESKGEPVSSGIGMACLGHPINAMIWLADYMSALETPLGEGDIVLSGALGPMVAAKAGDVMVAKINGIGQVSAHFEA